jgi:cell division transport system permease protein
MSVAEPRRKPGPILGPGGRGRAIATLAVILLTFAAALATIAAAAAARSAETLSARLGDDATIAVWGAGLESADAAAARAQEILAGVPGVKAARTLDPSSGDALIAQLMGATAANPDQVRLVAVDFAPGAPVAAGRLESTLGASQIEAKVDDHSWPASPTLDAAVGAIGGGLILILLVLMGVGLAVCSAMKRDMATRRPLVELLRLSGATDPFIARLFRGPVNWAAFWAATLGVAAAAVATGAWIRYGAASPLDALKPVLRIDIAWALPWPLAVVAIAAVGSWLAGRAALKPGS